MQDDLLNDEDLLGGECRHDYGSSHSPCDGDDDDEVNEARRLQKKSEKARRTQRHREQRDERVVQMVLARYRGGELEGQAPTEAELKTAAGAVEQRRPSVAFISRLWAA